MSWLFITTLNSMIKKNGHVHRKPDENLWCPPLRGRQFTAKCYLLLRSRRVSSRGVRSNHEVGRRRVHVHWRWSSCAHHTAHPHLTGGLHGSLLHTHRRHAAAGLSRHPGHLYRQAKTRDGLRAHSKNMGADTKGKVGSTYLSHHSRPRRHGSHWSWHTLRQSLLKLADPTLVSHLHPRLHIEEKNTVILENKSAKVWSYVNKNITSIKLTTTGWASLHTFFCLCQSKVPSGWTFWRLTSCSTHPHLHSHLLLLHHYLLLLL